LLTYKLLNNSMKKLLIQIRQSLGTTKIARRLYRRLPSTKRCKECLVPFLGLFSIPFSLVHIRPWQKIPNFCSLLYELSPPGGEVCVISFLFVDVVVFTALAKKLPPAEVAQCLTRFYALATATIFDYDGTLDKMVGD